eukprot:gene1393-1607_t
MDRMKIDFMLGGNGDASQLHNGGSSSPSHSSGAGSPNIITEVSNKRKIGHHEEDDEHGVMILSKIAVAPLPTKDSYNGRDIHIKYEHDEPRELYNLTSSQNGLNNLRYSTNGQSPSGSPKQDSLRTTPSGSSVNNSPFLSPRGCNAELAQYDANFEADSSSYPSSPGSREGSDCESRSPTFGPRSLACTKHSKWKKRCPDTCVGRVSPVEFPTTTRKLWSQEECCQLLEMVFQKDPQSVTSKESEQRWRSIANALGRTVTSTRKKYMRLMNKWSPRPMTSSVHPISKLIESNEKKRKCFEQTSSFPSPLKVDPNPAYYVSSSNNNAAKSISPPTLHHPTPHFAPGGNSTNSNGGSGGSNGGNNNNITFISDPSTSSFRVINEQVTRFKKPIGRPPEAFAGVL